MLGGTEVPAAAARGHTPLRALHPPVPRNRPPSPALGQGRACPGRGQDLAGVTRSGSGMPGTGTAQSRGVEGGVEGGRLVQPQPPATLPGSLVLRGLPGLPRAVQDPSSHVSGRPLDACLHGDQLSHLCFLSLGSPTPTLEPEGTVRIPCPPHPPRALARPRPQPGTLHPPPSALLPVGPAGPHATGLGHMPAALGSALPFTCC